MKNFKKILIIRLSAIGDVVNVLPALKALRKTYPYSHISWLVEDRAQDIIFDNPDLDDVIVFPRKKWQEGISNPLKCLSTIYEAIIFFKKLRKSSFDIVIDFHGNLKSGLMTLLSGKKLKLGFHKKNCKEWNHIFTNLHAPIMENRIHRIDKNLSLLKLINIETGYIEPQISLANGDKEEILFFLKKNLDLRKKLIVIHPGTSEFGEFKRWPTEKYACLADMLIERLNVSILFTWGPGELKIVNEITSLMKQEATISCKTKSLKQLTEIIRQSSIFISGDTGPMHIASVLGKPIVAIFGPKDPIIYGPYNCNRNIHIGDKNEFNGLKTFSCIVNSEIPCAPCKKRRCKHIRCLNTISAQKVFDATTETLNKIDNDFRLVKK